jgi:hypothetical protein
MLTVRDYLWALPALLVGAVAMLAADISVLRSTEIAAHPPSR